VRNYCFLVEGKWWRHHRTDEQCVHRGCNTVTGTKCPLFRVNRSHGSGQLVDCLSYIPNTKLLNMQDQCMQLFKQTKLPFLVKARRRRFKQVQKCRQAGGQTSTSRFWLADGSIADHATRTRQFSQPDTIWRHWPLFK